MGWLELGNQNPPNSILSCARPVNLFLAKMDICSALASIICLMGFSWPRTEKGEKRALANRFPAAVTPCVTDQMSHWKRRPPRRVSRPDVLSSRGEISKGVTNGHWIWCASSPVVSPTCSSRTNTNHLLCIDEGRSAQDLFFHALDNHHHHFEGEGIPYWKSLPEKRIPPLPVAWEFLVAKPFSD